MRHLSRSNL
jgi:hypothetical protein